MSMNKAYFKVVGLNNINYLSTTPAPFKIMMQYIDLAFIWVEETN